MDERGCRAGGRGSKAAHGAQRKPAPIERRFACYVDNMEARLVDLEIRYAHLEQQVAELNQVVFEQQKAIALCQAQLLALRTRVTGMSEANTIDQERPPHY